MVATYMLPSALTFRLQTPGRPWQARSRCWQPAVSAYRYACLTRCCVNSNMGVLNNRPASLALPHAGQPWWSREVSVKRPHPHPEGGCTSRSTPWHLYQVPNVLCASCHRAICYSTNNKSLRFSKSKSPSCILDTNVKVHRSGTERAVGNSSTLRSILVLAIGLRTSGNSLLGSTLASTWRRLVESRTQEHSGGWKRSGRD